MTLGIEACNRYETHLVNTARQPLALAERIDEPAVMIHLDTYHANIEEKSFPDALAEGSGRVRYVHLSESDRGVPGSGNVHWRSVLTALKITGYSGDLWWSFRHLDAPVRRRAVGVAAGRERGGGGAEGRRPYLRSLAQTSGLLTGEGRATHGRARRDRRSVSSIRRNIGKDAVRRRFFACASAVRQVARQRLQHRHPDRDAHLDLLADERLPAVGDEGVDLDAAIHRPGMHDKRAGLRISELLRIEAASSTLCAST